MTEIARTDRLLLRQAHAGDAAFLLALMNEPGWLQNIGDRGVRTVDDARGYIVRNFVQSYADHGHGLYVVVREGAGDPIGLCGLVRRDGLDHADIGFAFVQSSWSQGYALEAARAVMAHARDGLQLPRVLGIVMPSNARSIALLLKLGMQPQGTIRLPGADSDRLLYAIDFSPVAGTR